MCISYFYSCFFFFYILEIFFRTWKLELQSESIPVFSALVFVILFEVGSKDCYLSDSDVETFRCSESLSLSL